MDEIAKTEARNYLCAAGFFMIAAWLVLLIFFTVGSGMFAEPTHTIILALGVGLLAAATLLIVLHKRDMIAILFFMIGFFQLFAAFTSPGAGGAILLGFILLTALVTLTGQDKKKWMLFIIPLIWFVWSLINWIVGFNLYVLIIFSIILAIICLYYAFCCACERISLPGAKILTADAKTDFKTSGSALCYMLLALALSGFSLFYLFGNPEVLTLESVTIIKLIAAVLMIYVAVLLLAAGKMRFTPVMFLLIGITLILTVYASGMMILGCAVLFIIIGLFAILRKESRILPGIMLIIFGCSGFISIIAGGLLPSVPWLSVILNGIPALIAFYLAFAVYSQKKLPLF
ncbi:MAG TPA: hypothetical protein O0X97_04285 [Methanocorpusculum sp.]|nr:hypothetical protein [Methanocorpusculum sp.]